VAAVVGAGLLCWAALAWHDGKVNAVRIAAKASQRAADEAVYRQAAQEAEDKQRRAVRAAVGRQEAITHEKDIQHARDIADLRRAYDRKLRGQADREANLRRSGHDGAGAISEAARSNHEAYCEAAGWIPFGRALNMARDAEEDAAQARSCAAWVKEQWEASKLNEGDGHDVARN
jgi:hypothetical protein